jgi:hypothetical protein
VARAVAIPADPCQLPMWVTGATSFLLGQTSSKTEPKRPVLANAGEAPPRELSSGDPSAAPGARLTEP